MIIVKLMGGLGNQMFQYAIGRKLALLHGTELKLDHSFLESSKILATPRNYELGHFKVHCNRATVEDCSKVALHEVKGSWWRFSLSLLPINYQLDHSPNHIRERSFPFSPSILAIGDQCYLSGYWQTERYFYDIKEILQEEFSVRSPMIDKNLCLAHEIDASCAISLHVRRGDYVTNQKTAKFHGICGLDYYVRALNYMAENTKNPHFFIFSDDLPWVRENLPINWPVTYVEHNTPENGYEDLRLMTLCKHHIIANSSFSWWGAWLNASPNKIVVGPQRWFNDPTVDVSDLIPVGWIRL